MITIHTPLCNRYTAKLIEYAVERFWFARFETNEPFFWDVLCLLSAKESKQRINRHGRTDLFSVVQRHVINSRCYGSPYLMRCYSDYYTSLTHIVKFIENAIQQFCFVHCETRLYSAKQERRNLPVLFVKGRTDCKQM